MTRIDPFTIEIPEEDLQRMRSRLRETRWAEDFGNADWRYGVQGEWLREMVRYWSEDFDWRVQEVAMNRFAHFMTAIDGIPIHFIHQRGMGPNPVPLILTHGWPWTFWDWKDVIGPLSDPAAHGGDPADAFDVIVPSLPGFGFSRPLRTTGVHVRRVAELWTVLMRDVLGYPRYAAAGGDWGALITAEMGHCHPEPLLGVYMTLPIVPGIDLLQGIPESAYAQDEQWMLERAREAAALISSHVAVHVADPQTLAWALADSPVGCAAWLWERRRAWSDCDGDVVGLFGRDFLCTTASIYWLTNTIGSSFRIYNEHFGYGRTWPLINERKPAIPVPTGYGISPKELVFLPRALAEKHTNLQAWNQQPRGGHFAPSEQPAQVIAQYRDFFRPLRSRAP